MAHILTTASQLFVGLSHLGGSMKARNLPLSCPLGLLLTFNIIIFHRLMSLLQRAFNSHLLRVYAICQLAHFITLLNPHTNQGRTTNRSCSFLKEPNEPWDTTESDLFPHATELTSYLYTSEQGWKSLFAPSPQWCIRNKNQGAFKEPHLRDKIGGHTGKSCRLVFHRQWLGPPQA